MDIRKLNCVGDYSFSPHDPEGKIKGFTLTIQVEMIKPSWLELVDVQTFRISALGESVLLECDAYIRAYKIDLQTRLVTEITISTTGKIRFYAK